MCLLKNVKFIERNTIMKIHLNAHNQILSLLRSLLGFIIFLYIVDQAIGSLNRRFEQYSTYENIFGFLFNIEILKSFFDENLKFSCINLETYLKHDNSYDLDSEILYEELKVIKEILTIESKSSFMIFSSLKTFNCLSNACIAYRIILIILVTVASVRLRGVFKIKISKILFVIDNVAD